MIGNKLIRLHHIARFTVLGLLGMHFSSAIAVDVVPGEIRPVPAGKNVLLGGVSVSERDANYVAGQKQPGDPRIETITTFVRYGKFFSVADHPAVIYVQQPYRNIRTDGSLSRVPGAAGISDTNVVGAFWPYADFEKQRFLAIALYTTWPTGEYHAERTFNAGGNRFIGALQVGYHAALTDKLSAMATVDATWFGDNKAFGASRAKLEQDVLYATHVAALYKVHPKVEVAAGWLYTEGGETQVNGVSRHDVTRLHRAQLSGTFVLPAGRLQLQYGTTLKTENGFRENQFWLVRYTQVF